MELLLLLKLKWDIMVPTSKDFLTVLLKKLEIEIGFKKEEIKNHANTFIDLIILGNSTHYDSYDGVDLEVGFFVDGNNRWEELPEAINQKYSKALKRESLFPRRENIYFLSLDHLPSPLFYSSHLLFPID